MAMSWRNRFAFYLLAVGSACGLGNVWRFPYIAGENGGGAFILLYLLMAFTVGLSILIAELILGRRSEASLLKITRRISVSEKKPYYWISRFTLLITIVILSYYSVISGWVLHYITQFLVGIFRSDTSQYISSLNMKALNDSGWLQFSLASVHILVAAFIVDQRITNRFEKILTTFIIPVFAFLFVVLLARSLSLESTAEVLRFVFYPDFSKLNMKSLGHAIGHMCFTLSIGLGTLVTFGSYFKHNDHLPKVGFRVMLIDVMIALFSVLLVFPIAFSLGEKPLTDPNL
ncbi:MAG: sodium-dependent transporter, partial [Pseudobdellovibrio sp.]